MKHILSIITVFVLAGCSLPTTTIDTPAPPFISFATASLSVIDVGRLSGTVDTLIAVSATAQGKNITSVTAVIKAQDGSAASYALLDNGVAPDQKAGDGIYSGNIPLRLMTSSVGKYIIQVQASGDEGLVSNNFALPVSVISSNNRPPIISDLIVPDTMYVPASGSNLYKVSVFVSDADGLASIEAVTFSSYRSNGTLADIFTLFDDGATGSGDAVKGDGRYTLTIQLPAGTARQYRDFVFSAKDKSGAVSNSLTKRIYIQ